ncbi:MAG: hypothetical protein RLZZ292_565 [Bacteroidota bacterium]|jgi:hypothetical protein
MKKIIFFIIILFPYLLFSQNDKKRDYTWLLGYASQDTFHTDYSNIKIDFEFDTIRAKRYYTKMNFSDMGASICDTAGRLLFYTNCIYIADSTNEPMLGGEELYNTELSQDNKELGMPLPQHGFILPCPRSDSLYYFIYDILEYSKDYSDVVCKNLNYATIDMSQNNGKGKVITKNQVLIDNVLLDTGNMTAVRHANGRDWWMVVGKEKSGIQFRFLISPQGITQLSSQDLPPKIFSGLGQACFSPDGTKYVKYNTVSFTKGAFIDIYDFDRCSGLLSNHKQFNYIDTSFGGGVAISPNSRYLYVPSWQHVYQFDLSASDVFSTIDTVATYDGFLPPEFPISPRFYLAQLAPDNKIYISCTSSAKSMHVIHEPDKKGKACHLEQRGFKLPTFNYNTIPNYPYFRLGALKGSPCDTLGLSPVQEATTTTWAGRIYPNPASEVLHIEYPTNGTTTTSEVTLFDIAGKVVLKATLPTENTVIDVRSLPTGLYLCKISDTRGGVWYEKVSVVRYP